jgi:hypothetical protein
MLLNPGRADKSPCLGRKSSDLPAKVECRGYESACNFVCRGGRCRYRVVRFRPVFSVISRMLAPLSLPDRGTKRRELL